MRMLNELVAYRPVPGQANYQREQQWHSKRQAALATVARLLDEAGSLRVDGSVIKNTNLGLLLRELTQDKDHLLGHETGDPVDHRCKERAKEVMERLKKDIKKANSDRELNEKRGGNVLPVPRTSGDIACPRGVPESLWSVLRRSFNPSQLFAIRYICEGSAGTSAGPRGVAVDQRAAADTSICLVQGPPGTGKTSCVMGMVAALVHRTGAGAGGGAVEGKEGGTRKAADTRPRSQRLLVCAPSNAAVDELLTRMLAGVLSVQPDGTETRRQLKLVRLGEPKEDTSPEICALDIEEQTKRRLAADPVTRALEGSCARAQRLEAEAEAAAGAGQKQQLLADLRATHRAMDGQRAAVERRRAAIRGEILEEADVVAATLSCRCCCCVPPRLPPTQLLLPHVCPGCPPCPPFPAVASSSWTTSWSSTWSSTRASSTRRRRPRSRPPSSRCGTGAARWCSSATPASCPRPCFPRRPRTPGSTARCSSGWRRRATPR